MLPLVIEGFFRFFISVIEDKNSGMQIFFQQPLWLSFFFKYSARIFSSCCFLSNLAGLCFSWYFVTATLPLVSNWYFPTLFTYFSCVFIGMVITAIVGMIFGKVPVPEKIVGAIPSIAPTFGVALDAFGSPGELFTGQMLIVILTFLFVTLPMASPLSSLRSTTIFKTCHMLYAINWCEKFLVLPEPFTNPFGWNGNQYNNYNKNYFKYKKSFI